jgi:hypothetical protein
MTTLFDLNEHTVEWVPGEPPTLAPGISVRVNGNRTRDDFRDGVITMTDDEGTVWAKFNRRTPHPATGEKTIELPVYVPGDHNHEHHNPVIAWKR